MIGIMSAIHSPILHISEANFNHIICIIDDFVFLISASLRSIFGINKLKKGGGSLKNADVSIIGWSICVFIPQLHVMEYVCVKVDPDTITDSGMLKMQSTHHTSKKIQNC